MQSNTFALDNPTTALDISKRDRLPALIQNLHYSLQRRLENLVALSQETLEKLQNADADPTEQGRILEHHWVMLDDALKLAQNDWALLEWLR